LSRASRLLGSALCLAGGYIIGFGSDSQPYVKSAFNSVEGLITALPLPPSVESEFSSFGWFLIIGVILFVAGVGIAVIESTASDQTGARPVRPVFSRDPNSCKFCGAPMKGSKTYCPNCGKSQN
jgi:hypothetical protein